MARQAVRHPGDVRGVGHAIEGPGIRGGKQDQFDAADDPPRRTGHLDRRSGDIDQRLAVLRVGGIEIDELAHTVRGPVGHAGDDHSAVAVADKDHVAKILVVQYRHDVLDVEVQVHTGADQMGPLADARHGRRVCLVARPCGAVVRPAGSTTPRDRLHAPERMLPWSTPSTTAVPRCDTLLYWCRRYRPTLERSSEGRRERVTPLHHP